MKDCGCPEHATTSAADRHTDYHRLCAQQLGTDGADTTLDGIRRARALPIQPLPATGTAVVRRTPDLDLWAALRHLIATAPHFTADDLVLAVDQGDPERARDVLHAAEGRGLVLRAGDGRWRPPARVDRPRADVGLDHPPESHAAAAAALRGSGTLRAQVLALVAVRADGGATSDEVERVTSRAHQSVSATLYGLEKDGLCARTGPVRPTQYANDARAYVVTEHGIAELRRVRQPRPVQW